MSTFYAFQHKTHHKISFFRTLPIPMKLLLDCENRYRVEELVLYPSQRQVDGIQEEWHITLNLDIRNCEQ